MEKQGPQIIEASPDPLQTNNLSKKFFARTSTPEGYQSDIGLTNFDSKSLALPPSHITILSDSSSWLNAYLPELVQGLWKRGHAVRWIHNPAQLSAGDVCFLLSCGRLLNLDQLNLNSHNLVVHESNLPHGQGWSPMSWQILEGATHIPVTLFEATSKLDSGPIYLQHEIELNGEELVEDWRALQAQVTVKLCLAWLDRYREIIATARPQEGEPTHYRRRRPMDSQLDPHRTLAEQFDLLRIVDNNNYPAFFSWQGHSFIVKISRPE